MKYITLLLWCAASAFAPGPWQVRVPGPGGSTTNAVGSPCTPAAGYSHCRVLTLDHNQSGGSTLSSFPILVSLSLGSGRITNANCYDVVFTSDAGGSTLIPWEQESGACSVSSGAYGAWVLIASVSASADTVFYVSYGNGSISTAQNSGGIGPTHVWINSYGAVFHLSNGSTLSAADSVTGASGTINGPAGAASGAIDGGAVFGNHSSDAVTTEYSANLTQATYSMWVYSTGNGGGSLGRMFDKQTSTTVPIQVYLNGLSGYYEVDVAWSGGSTGWSFPLLSASAWHYVVVTYDNSSTANIPAVWVDNVTQAMALRTAGPAGTPVTNGDKFVIGNRANDYGRNWQGTLDEWRVATTIRSGNWLTAEWNNQKSGSTMLAAGSEN